jgi:hypothetical protein
VSSDGPRGGFIKPITVAASGKGVANLLRRTGAIAAGYGFSPRRMSGRLAAVHRLVEAYGSGATLPVTAAAAVRHPQVISLCARMGIEFAVHGYYHVDHSQLSREDQQEQLSRARGELESMGVRAVGFRAPYLRANEATLQAVRGNGFLYDSSQAFHWPLDGQMVTDAYRRALDFCASLPANEYPVLPWSEGEMVRIPCCLPDDEAIIDRLRLPPLIRAQLWRSILQASVRRGELFTLAVHPERIESCRNAVTEVLKASQAARPRVWLARLEEIAQWWRARAESRVTVQDQGSGRLRVRIQGPEGLTVLARDLGVAGESWADGFVRVLGTEFEVRTRRRPFLGVHRSSSGALLKFLREQGYIFELSESADQYSYSLRRERFSRVDERPLLVELESAQIPLLRLGRWPDGARSALSITGDVDALTIWDYASRFVGR